jgi:hypothetical protein
MPIGDSSSRAPSTPMGPPAVAPEEGAGRRPRRRVRAHGRPPCLPPSRPAPPSSAPRGETPRVPPLEPRGARISPIIRGAGADQAASSSSELNSLTSPCRSPLLTGPDDLLLSRTTTSRSPSLRYSTASAEMPVLRFAALAPRRDDLTPRRIDGNAGSRGPHPPASCVFGSVPVWR